MSDKSYISMVVMPDSTQGYIKDSEAQDSITTLSGDLETLKSTVESNHTDEMEILHDHETLITNNETSITSLTTKITSLEERVKALEEKINATVI